MNDPERRTISEADYRRTSRRSLLTGAAAAAAGLYGWRRILNDEPVDRIPGILRSVHERNGSIWQALYSPDRMAPTFDRSKARAIRVNGRHGVRDEIDADAWRASILGPDGAELGQHDINFFHALPFVEMTVEHKCVEGWSEVVTWGGTPFANIASMYADAAEAAYVGLATPDDDYYVGLERDAMLHPQTLLAWQLNGEPLTQLHGAPLRLVTPLKYGIKQIKRIGTIQFTNERPPDYWASRGYDYYSGL